MHIQLLHSLFLFLRRFSRNYSLGRCFEQVVKLLETRFHVAGLLAGFVGLDDETICPFGSITA